MGSITSRNPTAYIERCCYPGCKADRWVEPDSPPFCAKHMIECAYYIARHMAGMYLIDPERGHRKPMASTEIDQIITGPPTPSVVYYVRMGNHVKIGTTTNLEKRMQSFYLDSDPDALLATEPGDVALERQRHVEFRAERVYANRELFNPSRRLLAHIESLKAKVA